MGAQLPNRIANNDTSDADLVMENYDYLFSAISTGWIPANETWTYSSADDPTYVVTVPSGATSRYSVGMRVRVSQSTGGTKYFIITAVADTSLTLYGGTDYDMANETISSPHFSLWKAPYGFPLDPTKWTVKVTDTTNRSVSVSADTWTQFNAADAITIPIGVWDVEYSASGHADRTSAGTGDSASMALSTSTNSVSDEELVCLCGYYSSAVGSSSDLIGGEGQRRKTISLASKTTYYLLVHMQNAGTFYIQPATNYSGTTVIRAVCAYL